MKRIVKLIPVLIAITLIVFTLMYLTPGDPALQKLTSQGGEVTPELLSEVRHEMGLDRPFIIRYSSWVLNVLQGDLGNAYTDDQPVVPKLMKALGYTASLAIACTLFSVIIAVPLGVYTAIKKDSLFDNIIRIFTFTGNAMPNFLIALLLMFLFCIKIRAFPVIATASLKGMFLPTLALSIPMISRFARQTRADVMSQLSEEYVIGMHARGVKERVILFRNVLHNSAGSIITIVSLQIRVLIGGSVVTEMIFRWPGIGNLMMNSITARDFPVVQGAVLILATLQILVNLLTDLSYFLIDKRISLE
ncbi:ABC transporter permease [Fusibacter ferrireducens]|uniref:ABC transporter permease n=1 Tax=Fusibacter ferrireducens TaxID=2785058 RepID=UPI001E5FE90B|nr:ABC transporter permease [Fusibacter ferrireducens]